MLSFKIQSSVSPNPIVSSFCASNLALSSYFSFQVHVCVTSFSCPIALAMISSVMLNGSGEEGGPCFVPDQSRKASDSSPLGILLALLR